MYDSFNKAVASYVPGPKRDYWERVIHLLLGEGAIPLPPQHTKAIDALNELQLVCNNLDLCMEEVIEYAVHSGVLKDSGWRTFENHDRTMPIEAFVERELPTRIMLKDYWLLPVFDDGEWISWTFIFVPKDLEWLLKAITAVKEDLLLANDNSKE